MSSPSPSLAKHEQTKQHILDAALNLFIEFGLRRTTMDDVAVRAGIGRATLYRRFGDKDQLIQEVMVRECLAHFKIISEEIREIDNLRDALLESFALAAWHAHRHPLLRRLLEIDAEHILPHLSTALPLPFITLTRQYIASRIEQAQHSGDIRPGLHPEQTAEHMLRLIQSFVLSPQAGTVNLDDLDALRDFAANQLGNLLSPTIHPK